jgi:hypothetical protein
VFCVYDDDVFNDCVPSDNCKQLLRQAAVTGLQYGLFVTAMIDEGVSQIVQMVVVRFSSDDKTNHVHNLNQVAKPLLGWLYDDEVYNRGY